MTSCSARACRPGSNSAASTPAGKPATAAQAVEKVNDASAELRQLNESMIDKEVKKDVQRIAAKASAELGGHRPASAHAAPVRVRKDVALPAVPMVWSYEGAPAGRTSGAGCVPSMRRAAQGSVSRRSTCARASPSTSNRSSSPTMPPIQGDRQWPCAAGDESGRCAEPAGQVLHADAGAVPSAGRDDRQWKNVRHGSATAAPGDEWSAGHRFRAAGAGDRKPGDPDDPQSCAARTRWRGSVGGDRCGISNACYPRDRRYYAYMGSLTLPPCTENAVAGVRDAAADFGGATVDLPAPLSAECPAGSARLRADHQGIALGHAF